MKSLLSVLAALLVAASPLPLQAGLRGDGPRREGPLQGVWRNPMGTVDVRIGLCGATLCGTVVAASPSAIADARDSGYPSLVGMQILRDYRPSGSSRWQGIIFVPDMGRDFSSHIDMVDSDHVVVSGCLLGRFLCKSQLWRRA